MSTLQHPRCAHVRGFTLIELMIVVAIVAILAAIAIPAYQDYVTRAQVSEGLSVATGAKSAVWEFVADNGTLPADNAAAGLPPATDIKGKYVTQVDVIATGIEITYGNLANTAIASKTLVLAPSFAAGDGSVRWDCTGGTVAAKYRASACR